MKFRSRLFGILFLFSLAWLCYGFSATGTAFNQVVSTPGTTGGSLSQKEANDIRTAGAAIGSGIGLSFFMCSGLPFTLLFGLLSWRNAAGARNEERHQELLAKKDEEIAALLTQR